MTCSELRSGPSVVEHLSRMRDVSPTPLSSGSKVNLSTAGGPLEPRTRAMAHDQADLVFDLSGIDLMNPATLGDSAAAKSAALDRNPQSPRHAADAALRREP